MTIVTMLQGCDGTTSRLHLRCSVIHIDIVIHRPTIAPPSFDAHSTRPRIRVPSNFRGGYFVVLGRQSREYIVTRIVSQTGRSSR